MSERLDVELARRGLVESRARAQAMILAGRVRVDGVVQSKAGTRVASTVTLQVEPDRDYVSRGGTKLAAGLDAFAWQVTGDDAIDLGASTGGFSDCLLRRGASRVICVDVGYGQLHQRIRDDPRVVILERRNARTLVPADLPFAPNLFVADLSFISLTLVLDAAFALLRSPWRAVLLVKPQFEAGRDRVPRGGVIRDDDTRAEAIERVARYALTLSAVPIGAVDSGAPGPAGNHEYLLAVVSADHTLAREHDRPDPAHLARTALG